MKKKINKFLYWTPRILSIIFIIFLALFSLDVFDGNYTFFQTLLGLFMHNIPSLFLLITLLISWKHEIVGGIVFILAGIFYILMILINNSFEGSFYGALIIAGPAFFIGILFLLGWLKKKKVIK